MMTWDKHYFDNFDPLAGQASPEHPHFDVADRLLARARKVLEGKTQDDIAKLVEQFDSFHTDFYGNGYHERLGKTYLVDERRDDHSTHHPEIIELKQIQESFPLSDTPRQWAFLYALIAINTIAMGITAFQDSDSLFLASEVLALAETEHFSQQTVSDKARLSIQARHQPRNELKAEFADWYLENEQSGMFHSKNQAASRFYNQLPKERQALIAKTNHIRFFTEALRQHLKNT